MADRGCKSITDLDMDSMAQCASYLNLQDLSNMAMSCKYLNSVAYSDPVWHRLFRERWPQEIVSGIAQMSGAREAYLARRTALHQFKFVDPLLADFLTDAKPHDHLLLDRDIIFSQGPLIRIVKIASFRGGQEPLATPILTGHNARITCMRLFSLNETPLFRSKTQRNGNVLVTSSCDHSIRIWSKGCCQRCFRGHNGPVTTLSDKLLGNGTEKSFASGGEDGTVRLWSLSSSGKRGQHALKATLKGHEKPVVLLSVAGHKASLLVSMSKDSKVRVWDTTASSSSRSSCCVGMTSVGGAPVGMKCHESLLYIAAGPSVAAVDLRTMRRAFNTGIHQSNVYSFQVMPSKSLVCTGGIGRAMLWDVRRSSDTLATKPVTDLDGNTGPVTLLHMDSHKITSGGPQDSNIHVWETDTGTKINCLTCSSPGDLHGSPGCSAMAVDGCRIVTASSDDQWGVLRFRDFNSATCPVSADEREPASKFWGTGSYSDSDDSDGY
ncbi:hypothetical protein RJ640_002114 [Escallonia rubra]|uniref:Uncharacterized protein n=1 Tax=Escallonia rubra TaxID=112253 RepID=A0AA88U0N3_9ASTE|nr:hypothetical protein RJ640_002114 [Escallonia rubra]